MPLFALLRVAQPWKFNFVKRTINIRKRTKVLCRKYYLRCISNRPSGLFHLCRNEEFQKICREGNELAWSPLALGVMQSWPGENALDLGRTKALNVEIPDVRMTTSESTCVSTVFMTSRHSGENTCVTTMMMQEYCPLP